MANTYFRNASGIVGEMKGFCLETVKVGGLVSFDRRDKVITDLVLFRVKEVTRDNTDLYVDVETVGVTTCIKL